MQMANPETMRVLDVIGGKPTVEATGQIRFHVLPEESFSLKSAIGSVTIDAKVVKELVEDYGKSIVLERMKDHGLYAIIEQQMARRIEVAVKTVTQGLERDIVEKIKDAVLKRAADAAAAVPIRVVVTIDSAA